jgi:biopolymer transport protein ExbD
LPEDTQTPEIKQEDSIDVHVLRGGGIEVDGDPLSLEGLLPYVADKLKQNPDKPVILRTDPDATYGDMIRVFDELRQAPDKIDMEIKTISIPTRREIENLWSMLGIQ